MRPRAIHQFHPSLAPRDAVSNHVFALRELFRGWGYPSEAYAIEAKPEVPAGVRPYRRLFREASADDLLMLHFSIGSEAFDKLANLPAQQALVYHNVTPSAFFEGVNPHAALHTRKGRAQLHALAKKIPFAIGVSEFNRRELGAAGFARTAAVPILIDWSRYDVPPDERVLARWRGPHTNILFVGRISPNKRQDELVRLLAYTRACVDPSARLFLVGAHRDQPQYHARVSALAAELGLADAVIFTGSVSDAELAAYYGVASVFVSLSEHEGFAMPVLEAFRFGVPVIALDAGAVGETAGGAALLLREKDVPLFGETIALLRERPALRERLVSAGQRRLRDYSADKVAERMRAALELGVPLAA
ncbi:MAG: glycosyltransferase family 4 protein [Chloroflexota bacterium]|nr:glycosyltransferase family 4 protein [Chloroflexota bacterium]